VQLHWLSVSFSQYKLTLFLIPLVDYGLDVAGKPIFNITAVEGYAQIEVKYSETFT
jgi:hypothetical protein